MDENRRKSKDEKPSKRTKPRDDSEVVVETKYVPDGGWGWVIVFACAFLRMVVGGIMRSNGLFYIRFLDKFGGTAAETAWVTSLSGTVRLLTGPFVSILCNRFSARSLSYVGASLFVIALHISAYSSSLTYLYFSYGVLGGLGRSFLLTPCTILLSDYFNKRRSFAFGLASAGFGIGGFTITPILGLLFENYGLSGTYIIISGIACHVFISISLFRPMVKPKTAGVVNRLDNIPQIEVYNDNEEENVILLSETSSTGSIHLTKANVNPNKMADEQTKVQPGHEGRKPSIVSKTFRKIKKTIKSDKTDTSSEKKKLLSLSILKDIRFLTLCVATFIFSLPNSGVFLPALAKTRGITDIEAAYLLSIIAGSDTVSRIVSGFILDLKALRNFRPFIYNGVSFLQCLGSFIFPSLTTFGQFAAVCCLHGALMGLKAAQRNVILVDILGGDKLASSFAILLAVQGMGTLVGPPVSGMLKDTYGKYDYSFYFGGTAICVGSMILAGGNIRNYCLQKKIKYKDEVREQES